MSTQRRSKMPREARSCGSWSRPEKETLACAF
ncbi:ADP-ribosylation factor-like 3, isoform CRA_a [Rattus norvegicus]|uniref:ADP-ribosylation factor-like 3, isoform CRA_a n=1 Tax=Rattus norvegicus TaxID=10116 RepID=A6JHM8_RAT|nr:ADP-ribosylation factor-like 3, isoform CRA_a [Rattus norvegicus]